MPRWSQPRPNLYYRIMSHHATEVPALGPAFSWPRLRRKSWRTQVSLASSSVIADKLSVGSTRQRPTTNNQQPTSCAFIEAGHHMERQTSIAAIALVRNAAGENEADAPPRSMDVSAIDLLQTLQLTNAGRPSLYGNEVEIYSEENISLYDHNEKTRYLKGRCSLTTHRLFYIDESVSPPTALFLPLEWVLRTSKEAGFLARSAKIRVDIKMSTPPYITSFLKLSFKDGGRDDFYNPMHAALGRRAWKDTQPSHMADRRLQKREFKTADAGIGGILRRQKEAQKETTELAATAFTDLANLMDKARDMVGLMERYVDTIKATETTNSTSENGSSTMEEDINKLSSLMLDMGIISPVTRENSGSAYYVQLARQLAEFLDQYMPKNAGIMTLSDIYCMFNRARGVELVSPDDVYHAAVQQKRLKLGYHLRKFEGGLLVLQADSHREDRVADRLLKMAQTSSDGYITASDVTIELHTSLPLASEYLKVAEHLGKLCRDETFEGANFFPNKFDSFVPMGLSPQDAT